MRGGLSAASFRLLSRPHLDGLFEKVEPDPHVHSDTCPITSICC